MSLRNIGILMIEARISNLSFTTKRSKVKNIDFSFVEMTTVKI